MQVFAAQIGIKLSEFWNMTYSEFSIYVDAYKLNEKKELQKIIMQSWYTAVWQRSKKIEPLEDILENLEEKTDEKLLNKMNKLLGKLGG